MPSRRISTGSRGGSREGLAHLREARVGVRLCSDQCICVIMEEGELTDSTDRPESANGWTTTSPGKLIRTLSSGNNNNGDANQQASSPVMDPLSQVWNIERRR